MTMSDTLFALIGGSGFNDFPELQTTETLQVDTPYGMAAPITKGVLGKNQCLFMPRHGAGHKMPPHKINYRANLWALKQLEVSAVVGVNAVGGIHEKLGPGALAIPDQIIDYTYGREHTFFTGDEAGVDHVEFTHPYDESLRQQLARAAAAAKQKVLDFGVYGCTQGPRLETAAEVRRLRRDGCDMVGMTGMPEAALAAECGLKYACVVISVNWAAGLDHEPITLDAIYSVLEQAVVDVKAIVKALEL